MNKFDPIKWLADLKLVLESVLCKVSNKSVTIAEGFNAVANLLKETREKNNAVWWIGNGGSASLCAHLSQDLLNKLGIRSIALTDASLLTCMANDYGYPNVYLQPLKTLAQAGDLLIALSSSGKSKNILNCVELTQRKSMRLITLSGFDINNPLWKHHAEVSFYLPSNKYGHIEIGHEALLHAVIETMWLQETKGIK